MSQFQEFHSDHEYRVIHKYQGPLKAVVLDWAGTIVDCGSRAPMETFRKLFQNEGIVITEDEARLHMGVHKRKHIEKLLSLDRVQREWLKIKNGQLPTTSDIDSLYANFLTTINTILPEYSDLINGVVETISILRSKWHLKIGCSTGYPKILLDALKVSAEKQGFVADSYVAADEVPAGRPCPHMMYLSAIRMNVQPLQAIIKVDDTVDGIMEGISAGCWTVGVTLTGNYVGVSAQTLAAMSKEEKKEKFKMAAKILLDAGAHFVIETIRDLPDVIEEINRQISIGRTP